MSETILEKEKLKALSVDSRLDILKRLSKRRETLSDLSKKLNLSKPTLKEHLDILENAGFVKKIDSENIWKYYELTEQGQNVLNPSGIKVLFLSISSFVIGAAFLIKFILTNQKSTELLTTSDDLLYSSAKAIVPETSNIFANYAFIIAIILFVMGIVLLIYYLYKKRKKLE